MFGQNILTFDLYIYMPHFKSHIFWEGREVESVGLFFYFLPVSSGVECVFSGVGRGFEISAEPLRPGGAEVWAAGAMTGDCLLERLEDGKEVAE